MQVIVIYFNKVASITRGGGDMFGEKSQLQFKSEPLIWPSGPRDSSDPRGDSTRAMAGLSWPFAPLH